MNKFRFTLKVLVIATFVLAFTSIAQAQATRTWVSGVGDDVNPCSRTAPCKTFAGAISKTATNGEIDCLDPGGFGAVTINKGMTIDGTTGSGFGSILANGFTGVIINDGTGAANVILKNLSINGASSTAGSGIRFLAGRSLIVENCQIFGFTGTGSVGRGVSVELAANDKNVVVRNTSIQNCTLGIRIANTAGNVVTANIENVHIDQPTTNAPPVSAIELSTGAIAVIRSSFITRYTNGINITGAAPNAGAIVLGTTIWNCTTAIAAGNTTLKMSDSQLVNNTTGVSLAGGTFRSGCDNFLEGNTNNVTGGGITNACVQ